MQMRIHSVSLGLALSLVLPSGCTTLDLDDYYTDPDSGPAIFAIRSGQESEKGNLGGHEVVIEGARFGDDPSSTVVYFDSLNAEILEVSEDTIRVRTPRGPLQGGAVDVHVATENGISTLEGIYTYEVGDLLDNEMAHISAGNYWRSCLGGGEDVETAGGASLGCQDISYNGFTGTTGSAEFFDFIFPRIHTQNVGFLWATDEPGEGEGWKVETPAQVAFSLATDDLRTSVGDFSLHNESWEGKYWCADLDDLATWTYGGGEGMAPKILGGNANFVNGRPRDADYDCDGTMLDMTELRYCEVPEYGGAHSNEYEAFWPVGRSFFAGGTGNLGHTKAATVDLRVPGWGLSDVSLDLPEPLIVEMDEGFQPVGDTPKLWSVGAGFESCFDDDGDGYTDLDETAIKFRWRPSGVQHAEGDEIPGRTRVRFGITVISVGWFGAESYPVRATITLPDRHDVIELEDEETGDLVEWSQVEVPVSVLYQFPSTNVSWYVPAQTGAGGQLTTTFGDPLEVGQGYILVTGDRVTEYAIEASDLLGGGDVVFAYTTGDFGFFGFDHPNDLGPCGNCVDDDGDGWSDDQDPDCETGDRELGYSATCGTDENPEPCECHDGLDNDGDGFVDALDPDCEDPDDNQELTSACVNGLDDDGDGWIDDDDSGSISVPQCTEGEGDETGFDPSLECNDGLDNDGDGWIDSADPACEEVGDPEDDGFGSTECNDGIDNDGHGDVDAVDPICQEHGAGRDNEAETTTKLDCSNGLDDDDDGFTDVGDPDCEFGNESTDGFTSDDLPECYDGEDNDSDGLVDAEDPGCWSQSISCPNADAACPDGFLDDEGSLQACEDGIDNDADSWTDLDDPECYDSLDNTFGVSIGQEAGFGSNGCNDGLDNDADGWFDGADPGCVDAISPEDDGAAGATACNNGTDDDGDSLVDADDLECTDASDDDEAL